MSDLKITHAFFETIRAEHRLIEESLLRISSIELKNESKENLRSHVEWLWNFVELKHHYKEELILFQIVSDNPRISEGGPMCSLYFDLQLADSPVERCQRLTQQVPKIEEHQKRYFDQSSPLRIPINEHRSGKEILRCTLDKWNELNVDKILHFLEEYKYIQINHILKEESCFFHLCANLLTLSTADQMLAQWKIFQK